ICAGLFALRAMGGGDVKLLAALALWITPAWFLKLVIMMALLGGVLTIVMAVWHGMRSRRERLAIPYGVAISSAGLWALASQFLPAAQATAAVGGMG
ncbi:MAG: prepilin peptidase, partial [Novosphingobium sp.]